MEFQIQRRGGGPGPWVLFLPGAASILFGILILMLPEILVALVAGAFIFVGATLLSIAWRVRNGGRSRFTSMFGDDPRRPG
jgi:hypothetical protein